MCLGIPMQIEAIDGQTARCNANGIRRDVNLMLLQGTELVPGDFVMVHVGYAIQKVAEVSARSAWEVFDAMNAGAAEASKGHSESPQDATEASGSNPKEDGPHA